MASDEYIAAVAEIIRRAIELEATEHPELADIREHAEYWARYTLQVMLVLDGSTGQNALEQARHFTATTEVTALTITKLDGTAKGGVVLAIADQFKIPVKFIGVGEKATDLLVFDKKEFVDSLFGGVK